MNAVKKLFVLTSAMAAMSASGLAMATTTVEGEFYVSIRITPACTVSTLATTAPTELSSNARGADIDFEDHASNSTNNVERLSQAGTNGGIGVTCTKGTPYEIALTTTNKNGNDGTGEMHGVSGSAAATANDKIAYTLYQDAGRGKVWGTGEHAFKDLRGTGTEQFYPVYGRVAGTELNKTAGRYFDRVRVTVSY
ncbi:Csu type fimbrial protein [Neisseria dumasiana]|uniref:Spore coat protein U/FanG domain-containing protein n=1 Tax=Neisseria dumasiana TaxID=1931275 RepID=A0ABX3WK35_9NEIS|nr:spore coat U domain-containing protein [Neisseria dumasiana]OSI33846.1 hypothetical protein BV913_08275 [Neisseria dumasiana]UOO84563.1 spore coat U domain-containing protein [Neisseria dumasiana]